MTNTQIHTDTVKHTDADSYDPVTGPYDRFVGRYSGKYVKRIASLAEFRTGDRVLDVGTGTGTGIMALHVANCVGESDRVTGIDLSEGMLAHARAKADKAKLSGRVAFRRMDAKRLEFDDASFDIVMSFFARRQFPNPSTALAQLNRIQRARGRSVVARHRGCRQLSVY